MRLRQTGSASLIRMAVPLPGRSAGKVKSGEAALLSPVMEPEFDWQGDQPLHIPYEDCIVYRAHVRGLTKHVSSGTEHRGTFRGLWTRSLI